MTETAPAKLLATGGIRTVEKHVSKPVVYQFPVSFNSGKATLAMQLSQKADEAEIRYVLHMRDNYTPEYVRLNPDTMAVPTMEIDDKVCTDSMDLCKYLMDNYPGPGDQEVVASGRQAEMMDWVNFAAAWDEYMFTYGHMDPGSADMADAIRLENLRIYLDQVLTEKPADVDFLVNCYIKKIAGITTMRRAQETGADKETALEENKVILHRVLARGNDLVGKHPGGFLFGDKLTTADVYFLPIFRIFQLSVPAFFEEVWPKYANLQGYWERAKAHPDVEEGLMKYITKCHVAWAMVANGVPKTLIAYKMGLLKAPKLPDNIEQRIAEACEAKWKQVRG